MFLHVVQEKKSFRICVILIAMLNKVLNSLPEMANESYRIEYQPQLVEDTVLWVIAGRLEEKSFRKERNPIYQLQNEEAREENFQVLHEQLVRPPGFEWAATQGSCYLANSKTANP